MRIPFWRRAWGHARASLAALGGKGPEPGAGARQVVVMLGMHRSGTSMLAGTLQAMGLCLGRVVKSAPHNAKGNRESRVLMRLHEDLFWKNGGTWREPPEEARWERYHKIERDLYIDGFRGVDRWGFKDPRTLFVLDGWLEVLPGARCVGIFRHPELVARSLMARDGMSADEALGIWVRYNQKLLAVHSQIRFPIIEFGFDSAELQEKLIFLGREFGLPGSDSSFFDERLRHAELEGLPLSAEVAELYARLQSVML